MGHIQTRKLIVLFFLLLLVICLNFILPEQSAELKKLHLSEAIAKIEGWKVVGQTPLDEIVIDSLDLDDYAFMNFSNGENIVSLYIGYYLTSKKLGSAHDPLVCFPGQGWEVSDIYKKERPLINGDLGKLRYATMTVEKGQYQELVLYWFQSYDISNDNTFSQKVSAFFNRLQSKNSDNAFIRVSIPTSRMSIEKAENIAFDFIQNLYPVFIRYIKE